MAGSTRYTAVLDACVLYPAPVRDILLSLAHQGMYHARWTATINDEWIRNLARNRPDMDVARLRATATRMAQAIPDSLISGYERFITSIDLPDPDDRHVVAAALVGNLTEALKAIKAMRARLERPSQTAAQLLATLEKCGMPQSALLIAENAELI
jgi:hypothetical protein